MKISLFNKILLILIYILNAGISFAQDQQQLINYSSNGKLSAGDSVSESKIDSDINLPEALSGMQIPDAVINKLELVKVKYYGFDGHIHEGQLVVHSEVVNDIKEIFEFIYETQFPVEKVIPISEYRWSDEESMKDNNTSAFNYRFISGTRIHSMHASGLAIDINPFQNPYIKNHIVLPDGAVYDSTRPGTISENSQLVKEFKKRGWTWGGDWKNLKDYQHFEKKLK